MRRSLALLTAVWLVAVAPGPGRAERVRSHLTWVYRDIGFKVTPEMHHAYDPARAKKLLVEAGFPTASR